ncbi:MAG: hypothetical protein AAFP19_10395, partial [Bacteroidota bacterium]
MLNPFSKIFLILILLAFIPMQTRAKEAVTPPQQFPFSGKDWTINGPYVIETYQGKNGLFARGNVQASLKKAQYKNMIIEFDMIMEKNRGFPGVQFRMQDDENYEEVYFRPHQSGLPDAIQYTPVFNELSAWQLYHGENHSTSIHYRHGEWTHIKLAIFEERMEVFVDDMENPSLY